jgi:carbonic anhydrase/acetyltransferase-like protein (isoleucine patch superfamily)
MSTKTQQRKGKKMIEKRRTMISTIIVLSVLVLLGASFMPGLSETAAQKKSGMNIHPTADVHPSVILEGRVTVGPYTKIDAGTIITGNVTIGHHTLIRCNVTIRGTNKIGNYTHIYDNVNIEGGRPAKVGSSRAQVPDRSIIGDGCWINHGATMHGTQIGDGGAVGLNACCDYNTRIGKGAILANGSATHTDQVIPDNCFAEGVPAVIKKENITEEDRLDYFGLLPSGWTRYEAENIEASIRRKEGIQ